MSAVLSVILIYSDSWKGRENKWHTKCDPRNSQRTIHKTIRNFSRCCCFFFLVFNELITIGWSELLWLRLQKTRRKIKPHTTNQGVELSGYTKAARWTQPKLINEWIWRPKTHSIRVFSFSRFRLRWNVFFIPTYYIQDK